MAVTLPTTQGTRRSLRTRAPLTRRAPRRSLTRRPPRRSLTQRPLRRTPRRRLTRQRRTRQLPTHTRPPCPPPCPPPRIPVRRRQHHNTARPTPRLHGRAPSLRTRRPLQALSRTAPLPTPTAERQASAAIPPPAATSPLQHTVARRAIQATATVARRATRPRCCRRQCQPRAASSQALLSSSSTLRRVATLGSLGSTLL
mmetsp:Transcript_35647/g.75916  ORF Transcript_35647/g.75916 Transcript_35647/m.75916 type:complete len:200 (+) Transcript_35647:192-791(+)